MSEIGLKRPDWEIRRELRPGTFRTYAHGYWRDPFVVSVLGHTLIGKRALRRKWARLAGASDSFQEGRDSASRHG